MLLKRISIIMISFLLFFSSSLTVFATTQEEYQTLAKERMSLPVQSNLIENWPIGPQVSAESAILMEANTGAILYAKNIHDRLYPASTTKMMTCLVAMQNSRLDEIVSFSYDAVHSIPSDSSNMGIDAGQSLSMEECLYGIMVASANEVASAVAEHVGGTIDHFVEMMNETALSLGCKNTHFVNSNGLYDDNHYTSAYDLALIAKAYFSNDILRRIGNTSTYHFEATPTQPDDFYKTNKHKLITGEYKYDGIIGGKTGYTGEARQTLITGCDQNGFRLICVVLKEETPTQFEDTIRLFDYGYQNFTRSNISQQESGIIIGNADFFQTGKDIFGNSSPFLSINKQDYVVIPNMSSFEDLTSSISYDDESLSGNEFAKITYYFENEYVGSATIQLSAETTTPYQFQPMTLQNQLVSSKPDNAIFINIKLLILIVAGTATICILILLLHSIFHSNRITKTERLRRKRFKKDAKLRKKERRLSHKYEKKRRRGRTKKRKQLF